MMEDFNGVIEFDDPIDVNYNDPIQDQKPIDEPIDPPEPIQGPENLMDRFLKSRNIEDPRKIKFENDKGEIEEFDFNALDPDEQLEMLNELSKSNTELSEHESEVIEYLRSNKMTFADVVQATAQQMLNEYLEGNFDLKPAQKYEIDSYSDDELYAADLKSKYPDFTDEEILSKLELAKSHEELFTKEVNSLRNIYKAQADKEANDYKVNYDNNLRSAITNFNEVSIDPSDKSSDRLELTNDDKNLIYNYLTNTDVNGETQFEKDSKDPQTLVELAWLKTQGSDLLSGISNYWKSILKEERKEIAKLKKQLESKPAPQPTKTNPKADEPTVHKSNQDDFIHWQD